MCLQEGYQPAESMSKDSPCYLSFLGTKRSGRPLSTKSADERWAAGPSAAKRFAPSCFSGFGLPVVQTPRKGAAPQEGGAANRQEGRKSGRHHTRPDGNKVHGVSASFCDNRQDWRISQTKPPLRLAGTNDRGSALRSQGSAGSGLYHKCCISSP